MKIELKIDKEKILKIIKEYQEDYEAMGYDFDLSSLLEVQFIEDYFETVGTFKLLNKEEVIDIIKKEINIEN